MPEAVRLKPQVDGKQPVTELLRRSIIVHKPFQDVIAYVSPELLADVHEGGI